jgi:hypothetical protein
LLKLRKYTLDCIAHTLGGPTANAIAMLNIFERKPLRVAPQIERNT